MPGDGAIATVSGKNSIVSASNVSFTGNEAIHGGVAKLKMQGSFNCLGCVFERNFGLRGSVFNVFMDSKVNLTSC